MEHVFFNHLLKKLSNEAIEKPENSQLVLPSIYLFLCLIILVTVKQYSFSAVLKTIQSTFNFQFMKKFEREDSSQFRIYTLGLNLFFILNMAFLAYVVNSHFELILPAWTFAGQFCFFFGLIVLILLYKTLVNMLIVFITRQAKGIKEYTAISSGANQSAGLILFPLMVLIAFSSINSFFVLYLALFSVSIVLLIKWLKGVLLGIVEERIGILQIFAYFCALEILPGLVAVKYVIETF